MPAPISVTPVSNTKQFRRYLKLPWKIYRGDPNWVAPLLMDQKNLLDTAKNPFFEHSEIQHFLAYQEGEPVGRISGIVDRNYNDFQKERTGFFGFFEAIENEAVAEALFSQVEGWLKARNMERMRGPTNPSMNDTLSLLVEGFDRPPVIHMPYNPPYYEDLFLKCGLKKAKDLYAYYAEDFLPLSDKIKRVAEIVQKRNKVTVRPIDLKHLSTEIELIKIIYNDAWADNWGFVPWTDRELEHLAQELKRVVVPELVLLAFVDQEPVGWSLALPDLNIALRRINGRLFPLGLLKLLWYSRKIDRVRVLVMGVRKKFQAMGIDSLFYYLTYTRGVKMGFHSGEFSWVLEDNQAIRNTLENWGARIYKTYRLFDKEL